MEKLTCEICGNNTLIKHDDLFRCADCGACYTTEQLKKMQTGLDKKTTEPIQQIEEEYVVEQTEQENEFTQKKSLKSYLHPIGKKIKKLIPLFFVLLIIWIIYQIIYSSLCSSGVISDKTHAKELTKNYIENNLTDAGYTLESIDFTTVKANKFKMREEDIYGYFEELEKPLTYIDSYGNEYKYDSYYEWWGISPDHEGDCKWGYILQGTIKASHETYGTIETTFDFTGVDNITRNDFHFPKTEILPPMEALNDDLRNELLAYLIVKYDIKPNPNIQITSIEEESTNNEHYPNFIVYGKVEVKDNYGDTYSGKFTAKYSYSKFTLAFDKISLEVDELAHSKFADLFK